MASEGERIAALETRVDDMHHTLFGNGQPGELKEMRRKLDEMKWWIIGAACAGILGNTGASAFVKFMGLLK